MEKFVTSNLNLGIIAGGQLAKMLVQEASKWDVSTHVLDKDETCPTGLLASNFQVGNPLDFDDVYSFGKRVDTLTFELENINVEALHRLKSEGVNVVPDPSILELIQDKGLQKSFYLEQGIPTASFQFVEDKHQIDDLISSGQIKYPFVQKLRKGGYDGRGVAVINTSDDQVELLDGPSVIEPRVDIDKEIAVIVARNQSGEVRCFPSVEMVFDAQANLVEKLICPATIVSDIEAQAKSIAIHLVESFGMVGLLAVELFLDTSGNLLVNEVAPRPHNSGHHTIESIMTSQFEQHLRTVLNLPLGSTDLMMPAVMLNILGEPGFEGPAKYQGLSACMAVDGVKVHIYGKAETRPMRKMGHITVMSDTLESAIDKAEQVKHLIKVKS